jgi:cation diffusion facilitator CzcD-associated flavoprotein CzcO
MAKSNNIVIIGAGMSGIAMGVNLLKRGETNFTIYEKSAFLGGTWYDNEYPGCGCDVPSLLYSFSFEQYSDWDCFWAKQPQILK